jgi:hypothetical protein
MSTRKKILFLLGVVITARTTLGFCGEESTQVPTHQPGLVAYYSFDEGKGNVVKDLSGNGNDGTVSPNARWIKLTDPFAVQLFGYALEMSAAVNCGSRPTLALTGNHLTLEAWFKTDGPNRAYPLINKFATDWKTYYRDYALNVEKNNSIRLWLGFGDEAKNFDTESILDPHTFYHVIATYDGKFVKIYINGRLAASRPEPRALAGGLNDPLYIGEPGIAETSLIDQVKIFNRTLSAAEIAASYAADKLHGQYKLVDGTGGIGTNSSPNLLINSAFKRCANPGVPDWWGTALAASIKNWPGVYGIDDAMTPPVPGVKCLRVRNPWPSRPGFWVGSTFTGLPGKKEYTFSVYLKTDTPGLVANIDASASKQIALTTDWQRCVASGFRNDSAAMGGIEITIIGRGTVWLAAPQLEFGLKATPYLPADSEHIRNDTPTAMDLPTAERSRVGTPPAKKTGRPALQAMTEYDYYTNDKNAWIRANWSGERPAELEMGLKATATGQAIPSWKNPVKVEAGSFNRFEVPLTDVADGEYELTVKALVDGQVTAVETDRFSKLPPRPVEVRTNKPGRYLMADGRPFLAYGPTFSFYWMRCAKGGNNVQANVLDADNWQTDDIKNHAFNSLWVDFSLSTRADLDRHAAEYRGFLDECQRKGLKVLFFMGLSPSSYGERKDLTLEIVRRFKQHPAILAWMFVDEPDLWWENKTEGRKESDLLDLYRAVKTADPYRPAFINWCFWKRPPYGTLEASDIASVDRYPLRYSTLAFAPEIVSELATEINRDARPTHKPTLFFLQLQGFWDMAREPVPAEVRWMSYVNLISGTRLLQYFSYKPMSPRLWESMRPLGAELQELFRLITSPDACELANGAQGSLIYSLWRSQGKHYLLFANAATKPIVTDLDLHEVMATETRMITPLFENPASRPYQGRLTFSLQPLQCGAYRLQ